MKGSESLIRRYLSNECAEFNCHFSSWEQAVRYAGLLLLRNYCIIPAYIQRMVDTIKEYGSYIVFAEGVAIAHAKPLSDVRSSAMSAVCIPGGVVFPQNGGLVNLVLAIAVEEPTCHFALFRELASFLCDSNAVSAARRATNYDELVESMSVLFSPPGKEPKKAPGISIPQSPQRSGARPWTPSNEGRAPGPQTARGAPGPQTSRGAPGPSKSYEHII